MDMQRVCAAFEPMTDADVIRAVWPRDTMKLLARAMGAPLDTARSWLYRECSASRRQEIAAALLAELDRQDAERERVRQRLLEMRGGHRGVSETIGLVGRESADPPRGKVHQVGR